MQVLAQALGEYGAITWMLAGINRALTSAQIWFQTTGPERWLILGAAALLVLWLLRRRR